MTNAIKPRAPELEPSEYLAAISRLQQAMHELGRKIGEGIVSGLDPSIETTGHVVETQKRIDQGTLRIGDLEEST